jgi:hypothetical protein
MAPIWGSLKTVKPKTFIVINLGLGTPPDQPVNVHRDLNTTEKPPELTAL